MGTLGSLGHVSLSIDMKPLMHLWIPEMEKDALCWEHPDVRFYIVLLGVKSTMPR